MITRSLLLPTLFLVSSIAPAQTTLEFKSYELLSDLVLQETTSSGAPLNPAVQKYCYAGWRFSVIDQKDGDNYIITFFDWYDKATLRKGTERNGLPFFRKDAPLDAERKELAETYNYDLSRNNGLPERFFIISKYQLEKAAGPLTTRLTPVFGAMVLPFKYRPQTGLVTKDLGLGALAGLSFRSQRKSSLSFMFGVNVSSITVDSASTEGRVIEPAERSALSLPVGMLFQWESLQVALLMGWDLMFDGNKDQWRYQGRHWFTIGVGVAIFNSSAEPRDMVQK